MQFNHHILGVELSKEARVDSRVLWNLACGILWGLELFWIQSLSFDAAPWIRYPFLVQGIRLALDLIFGITLVFVLPRILLAVFATINAVMMTLVGTYVDHFHWPFMPVRAMSEWKEGLCISQHLKEFISIELTCIVVSLFVIKLFLLLKAKTDFSFSNRLKILGIGVMMYLGIVAGLQLTHLRLCMGPSGGPGRAVFAYGYSLPWVCDLVANHDIQEHVNRAKEYFSHHYDNLSPVEDALSVKGNVVVLQLESVCGKAPEVEYRQEPIMPFLKGLKNKSMNFRIRSFHRNGSCDMDYAAITGIEPYPGMVPYRLPGLKYSDTMPVFMKKMGYKTYFYHGNTAVFYDRGPLISKAGFDKIYFKEQLAAQHLPSSIMGVRDAVMFDLIAKELEKEKKGYFFYITLDTHVPYQEIAQSEMEVFKKPKGPVECYLNSLRYLDHCLRDFINRIPNGTTVVMYGDHTTSMESYLFQSDTEDGKEYVTCLIYKKGEDLSLDQETLQNPIATNGSLNLLDIMNYLRASVKKSQEK